MALFTPYRLEWQTINPNPKQKWWITNASLAVKKSSCWNFFELKINGTSTLFLNSYRSNFKTSFWTLAKSTCSANSNRTQRRPKNPRTSRTTTRNRDGNVVAQPHHRLRRDDGWHQQNQWGKSSFSATIAVARCWRNCQPNDFETSPIAPIRWISIPGGLLVGICPQF